MFRRMLTPLCMFLLLLAATALHTPVATAQEADTTTTNDDETQTEENTDTEEDADNDEEEGTVTDSIGPLNTGQLIKERCAGLTGLKRSECVRSTPLLRPQIRSGMQYGNRNITSEGAVKQQCKTLDKESPDYRECVRRARTGVRVRSNTLSSGEGAASVTSVQQGRERPARRIESRDFFRFKNNTIQRVRSRNLKK
ncbi:MAG TPA: hypothetical protein DEB30_04230 [Candidatus Peribacter riflensis]|nr:hypothetical protein [Candidatus Peribacter riflensis]